ncbi:hypothetical protein [Vibrio anguillarum]|uniref:hypothetical protein n=1 Tax=Vibrio anguillarum TaxID=55601 RepID=UPI000BB502F8|nr:hypothetical protein [Vibrio anguillarum]ATC60208.1 hypothetical protein CMV05_22725 [Vibrio anguillarum]MBF4252768.1 hypothetical protein [Vibrio anguillarum]
MNGIRITNNGTSINLPTATEQAHADKIQQTGLLVFVGGVGSGKLTLAQATLKQFNTEVDLYEDLRNRVMASECLEKSKLKLCFATIHAESESDVSETLKELGLLESIHRIKAIHYCHKVGQKIESRQLELG